MSESHAEFEIVEFEQVEAAPGTALLRIAARPAPIGAGGPLTLIISDGENEHRHPQLPALPGSPELVRAAFSAPMRRVQQGVSFSLEFSDGTLAQLPAPSERQPTANAPEQAAARLARINEVESSRLAEVERRAEARRLAIAELERRLGAERERRHATEASLAQLRADRNRALVDREQAMTERDEAVADREQAEARARNVAANSGTLEAQLRASADKVQRARASVAHELEEKDDEIARVRQVAELAQARAHANRQAMAELEEQLVHAQAQISVLEQVLEERGREAMGLSADTEAALISARAQITEARIQITELEHKLASAQELVQRSDIERSYDRETTEARLEVAHAELEVSRNEIEALRRRGEELEATIAELEGVLTARIAEIDLLRGTLEATAITAVDARTKIGQQLALELEAFGMDEIIVARAESELLREQALIDRERVTIVAARLEEAEIRATVAESALQARTADLQQLSALTREQVQTADRSRAEMATAVDRAQAEATRERERAETLTTELERVRSQAAQSASDLAGAAHAVATAQSEAESHKRHVDELSVSLASAQRTLREVGEQISTHEDEHRELRDALRGETQRRVRAEEALVAASAARLIASESLALEATAREQIEMRAHLLSDEQQRLESRNEALFERLVDEHARAEARIDVLRQLS